jgi:hypothetical protein
MRFRLYPLLVVLGVAPVMISAGVSVWQVSPIMLLPYLLLVSAALLEMLRK